MESDPSIEKEGQEAFKKLEAGDPEMRAIWKRCVDISLKEFEKTYSRYQVTFDHFWGESHYEDQLKPLLSRLKDMGILVEDQGAQVVHVTSRAGKEIPPCILEKSDGASIYATRDVAAALYRHDKFQFDRMSYIVGKEQMLHFEQVFGVLRAMGLPWETSCEHIATGLYRFKDAKMSTRKGNFITLEEVNELCTARALELMRTRNSSEDTKAENRLTEGEIETIADQVAIGALVFADLSTDPAKDLEFDVDRVISFEGETGPYLQYAHTRCLSILRKSEMSLDQIRQIPLTVLQDQIQTQEELRLLGTLARFPEALERTLDLRKPSMLTSYLIDVTRDFGLFYRECKVVNPENPDLTSARLALVLAAKTVLSLGLDLLGIPKPEKM
jgi:arginyl-tRNA synthetase